MPLSLEPEILQQWLVPFNLTLSSLIDLPFALQSEILRFIFPFENFDLDELNKPSLNLLAWVLGNNAKGQKSAKKLWQVLFEVFLYLKEPGPAAFAFSQRWPEPEVERVTYFSELLTLELAKNDLEAANQVLLEMQMRFPDRYTTFVSEAEFYLSQNDFNQAQTSYFKTLELFPNSRRIYLYLAQLADKQNKSEETVAYLEELEAFYEPDEIRPSMALRLWQKSPDSKKAEALAEQFRLHREKQREELCRKIAEITLSPQEQFSDIGGNKAIVEVEIDKFQAQNLEELPEFTPVVTGLPATAYQTLNEVFGYPDFRPGQAQVIASVLAGKDTLAILPTGAGKSLCYQLPALLLNRPVLVLSPLISLMKDQFDKLPPKLKEQTLIINSSVEPAEAARRLAELAQPDHSIRLIYAAPERLRQTSFINALGSGGLGLVVVDEAHCVAMWGNDFRPDYLFIRRALSSLTTPVLAVTATATPQVTQEIIQELGRTFEVVRGSVFRANLSFSVGNIQVKVEERFERVAQLCKALPGSGIIYTRSREKCEQVAEHLRQKGLTARPYHAGMENTARNRVQESWNFGETKIVVATIAFGMGIDKADVRFIIHFNPATSLENYMQEAGRAGRDGQPAQCIMLYSSSDKGNLSRWLREEHEQLNLEILREVYRIISRKLGSLRRGIIPMNQLLTGSYSVIPPPDESIIRVAFSLLENAGLLERGFDLPSITRVSLTPNQPALPLPPALANFLELLDLTDYGPVTFNLIEAASRSAISPLELDKLLSSWHEAGFLNYQASKREPYFELKEAGSDVRTRLENLLAQRLVESEKRLDKLSLYLKSKACRQVLLANHFGEKLSPKCGTCDNCTEKERPSKMPRNSAHTVASSTQSVKPVQKYSPDEITAIILGGLRMITGGEGQVGRSGLVNLLLGKRSAFGTTASNPYKGKFAAFRVKEAENLVEKLVLTGLIEEHPAMLGSGRTYQAIQVSDQGQIWLDDHKSLLP